MDGRHSENSRMLQTIRRSSKKFSRNAPPGGRPDRDSEGLPREDSDQTLGDAKWSGFFGSHSQVHREESRFILCQHHGPISLNTEPMNSLRSIAASPRKNIWKRSNGPGTISSTGVLGELQDALREIQSLRKRVRSLTREIESARTASREDPSPWRGCSR